METNMWRQESLCHSVVSYTLSALLIHSAQQDKSVPLLWFPCWAAKQDILLSNACHQRHPLLVNLQPEACTQPKPLWKKRRHRVHGLCTSSTYSQLSLLCTDMSNKTIIFLSLERLLIKIYFHSSNGPSWSPYSSCCQLCMSVCQVLTHSTKLCISETRVSLIGLFIIVIKFHCSVDNVWISGHADYDSGSPQIVWKWGCSYRIATLVLTYFLPACSRDDLMFCSCTNIQCLNAVVSPQGAPLHKESVNISELWHLHQCVASFKDGFVSSRFGFLLFF